MNVISELITFILKQEYQMAIINCRSILLHLCLYFSLIVSSLVVLRWYLALLRQKSLVQNKISLLPEFCLQLAYGIIFMLIALRITIVLLAAAISIKAAFIMPALRFHDRSSWK